MKFQYIFAAVFATVAMAAPAAESPATPSVRCLVPALLALPGAQAWYQLTAFTGV